MPLRHLKSREPSSLPTTVGDVRRLGLDMTKRESFPDSARLYEELQASGLYDKVKNLWYANEDCNGYDIFDQIFDLLIKISFHPSQAEQLARDLHELLMQFGFISRDGKYINHEIDTNGTFFRDNEKPGLAEFLVILMKLYFNLEEARAEFIVLKETNYDAHLHVWHEDLPSNHYLFLQLTAILLESELDPEGAEKTFHALKNSELYDKKTGVYRDPKSTLFSTQDQLLSILIETRLNPQVAKEHYAVLKASTAYNSELHRWNNFFGPGKRHTDRNAYSSAVQLLEILILKSFEKLENTAPTISVPMPPQPEALTI